jgi:hypothetical protein
LVDVKPLSRILAFVGFFSVSLGYVKAYVGPFFTASMHNAGYTYQQISSIFLFFSIFWLLAGFAVLFALVFISYHYGAKYTLTLRSGFVLVLLVYLVEILGNLVGVAIYQIQVIEYPTLKAMIFEILMSYSYVYPCLIGVLAANYVRERSKTK